MRGISVIVIAALASGAVADELPLIEVTVGDSIHTDVGVLRGMRCDDLKIIKVQLVTRDTSHNDFIVTGVEAGTTQCRVGTDVGMPYQVFDIRVLPAKPHP